jgi:hypothetical protein
MISRCIFVLSSLLLLCDSPTMAEEFIITIEHLQKEATGDEDIDWIKAKTMRVVETKATLDQNFYFQLKAWPKTMTYKGKLSPGDNGNYKTSGYLKIEQESKMMIPVTVTRKEPVIDIQGTSTTVSLKLDSPLMIGQMMIADDTPGRIKHTKLDEFVLTISRVDGEKK